MTLDGCDHVVHLNNAGAALMPQPVIDAINDHVRLEAEIGGVAFSVLHCPGHTPGHVVFASKETGFAIVGDVLFRGSIGRTDFPYGDHAALIEAIHRKLLPLGDGMRFLCGHGPGSTFGEERRSNPFLR